MGIDWNGLRISEGASGFMSHMSMCDAPPQRKKRIVDLAGLRRGAAPDAPNAEGPKLKPARPAVEAARNVRRLCAALNKGSFMRP